MKNSFLWLLFALTLSACNKKSNNSNNTPTQPQVAYPNTVKLVDNGKTYTITGYSSSNPKAAESPVLIDAYLATTSSQSYDFDFDTYSQDAPFQLSLGCFYPDKNGLYTTTRVGNNNRSIELNYISSIYKTFSLDSGFVTITHYDPDKITGEFQLFLDNGHEKRNVKGSFDINEPEL